MEKIFYNYGIKECKAIAILIDGVLTVTKNDYQATESFRTQYQSAVGSLIYTILSTRSNLAFLVSVVNWYTSNPNSSHW